MSEDKKTSGANKASDAKQKEADIQTQEFDRRKEELDQREEALNKREQELNERESNLEASEKVVEQEPGLEFEFRKEKYKFTDDAPKNIRFGGLAYTQKEIAEEDDILVELIGGDSSLIEKL